MQALFVLSLFLKTFKNFSFKLLYLHDPGKSFSFYPKKFFKLLYNIDAGSN
jgi:hypothetical protein